MKIKVFFFVFATISFLGCGKDASDAILSTGEADVEMRFLNLTQTRAPIDSENTIHTVDLLIFDPSGGSENNAVFQYSRYAWLKSGSIYRAVLKEGTGLNIYVAINARALIDNMNSGMASGTTYTYADVKEMLVMSGPDNINLTDGLPMWGMVLDCTIEGVVSNSLGTVRLLRSAASTDITISADNFTLGKGHIVYGADKGYLPYSSSNTTTPDTNSDFQTSLAEAPAGMLTNKTWYASPASGENEICNVFYLYENDADGTESKKQTKVILEGKWSESTKTDHTFYPLAFRDPDTDDKLEVKRNTKYIFNITHVNGDGYDSFDEAIVAEDVNMDYDVIEWNQYDDGEIIIDGPNHFSMPSKKAILAPQLGATAELAFTTNYALSDILMKFAAANTGVANVIDTHNRFKVEVVTRNNSDGTSYTCFAITTKQRYGTSDNPAALIVTVGRLEFTIEIEQKQVAWEAGGDIGVEVTFP